MNRAIQLIATAAAVIVATLIAYATVFAHADYESSVPARDEVVAESPERVEVFFTQDVIKREGLYYVRVFDESSVQVSAGDGLVNDDNRRNMSAELPDPLEPGRYIVEWMTTSDEDGDDATGAFCFYVAVGPTAEQAAECAAFGEDEDAPTASQGTLQPTDAGPTAPSATDAPADGGDEDDESNTGLIVGIIVAVVALVVVAGGGYMWLSRRS